MSPRGPRTALLVLALLAVNAVALVAIRDEGRRRATPRPSISNAIGIASVLPRNDIENADRITINFEKELATAGEIAKPLQRAPFLLDPPHPGHWEWATAQQLVYILDSPLQRGHTYRLTPAPDVEAQLGGPLAKPYAFTFQAQRLALLASSVTRWDRTHATLELRFNQKVGAEDLARQFHAFDARTNQSLEFQPSPQTSDRHAIRLSRPASNFLRFELGADLTGFGSPLNLRSPITREIEIKTAFSLIHAGADASTLENNITVYVRFSAELDPGQSVPELKLEPPVAPLQARISTSGITLDGPFECGVQYTLTIPENLLSNLGQTLGEAQRTVFKVPNRPPMLAIHNPQGILSPDSNLLLDLRMVNAEGLMVDALRIHSNNLVWHLQNPWSDGPLRPLTSRTYPVSHPANTPVTMALELGPLLDRKFGIFKLDTRLTNQSWARAEAIVTVSDMAITAKRERNGYFAWMTSIRGGKPLAERPLRAVSFNNQNLASGETDSVGILRLPVAENHPDGAPWILIAEHGDDQSYLRPEERPWALEGKDLGGREFPRTYDVMLYAERGVYRPGDTIHLTGLIRGPQGQTPPAFPLAIRIFSPSGRIIETLTATPDPARHSMFQLDYAPPANGRTGLYQFQATLPGSEEVLGSTRASVEAFVPVRTEVTASAASALYQPPSVPVAVVEGRYLFGQPASGLNAKVMGNYETEDFTSAAHPDFRFGGLPTLRSEIEARAAQLDDTGEASIELPAPSDSSPRRWRARMSASVTETGGRTNSANFGFVYDAAGRHVGIRPPEKHYVTANETVDIAWMQRTANDEAAEAGALSVGLFRVEYDITLEKVGDRPVWKSIERLLPVTSFDVVPAAGAAPEGVFGILCPEWGQFRVVVTDQLSKSRTQLTLYAARSREGVASFESSEPDHVEIVLDQERYKPGSVVEALIRSPFPGTLLLTLETDRVLHHEVVEIGDGSEEISFKLPEDVRANAYVTASVIRAVDPSADEWLPHRAKGMTRLVVDSEDHRLPVELHAPSKAKPGETIEVTAKIPAPADPDHPGVVHLWAVDEGILLATAYETPDPFAHFLAFRRPAVMTSDLFSNLLPDYRRPADISRIGGDGEADRFMSAPVATDRREAALVWNQALPVDAEGRVSVKFDLPELTGELRVMAVAVEGDRYGSAAAPVTLTLPLLVEPAWPRFVAPDDTFSVPVKLFNSTTDTLTVAVAVDIDGPISIVDAQSTATVEPALPHTHWFEAKAGSIGSVRANVRANSRTNAGEILNPEVHTPLSVQPVAPLRTRAELLRIDAGQSASFSPPPGFIPGATTHSIRIGARPTVQLRSAVESLLDYPYGCIEQTASRLTAMLYAPDLVAADAPGERREAFIREMIEGGIGNLWAMQTPSGGFGFWPGSNQPDRWGSAYAANFLLEAREHGFEIDERLNGELLQYLETTLNYSGAEKLDLNTKALICRVLAGFDRPQEGWMARLGEQLGELDVEGRAWLALAWMSVGRRDRAVASLPGDTPGLRVKRLTRDRLSSQVRGDGALLQALLQIDPKHAWIPQIVSRIEAARGQDGRWGNTLETASALTSLVRYQLISTEAPDFKGTLTQQGHDPIAFSHEAPLELELDPGASGVVIASSGTGDIYLAFVSEGPDENAANEIHDNGLKVRRRWLDSAGNQIDPATVKVGDLIYVEVTLKSVRDSQYNIAVLDRLPGGMEVENPRLSTSAGIVKRELRIPAHAEFLDDRVVLFDNCTPKAQTYIYAIRAITAGRFTVPPIQATAMYDASFDSVHGKGVVVIKP